MHSIVLTSTIESPWIEMEPKRFGDVPANLSTPDQYALITSTTRPALRLDFYHPSDEYSCFKEAIIWNDFAAIGFAERLYLIGLRSDVQFEFKLGSYFGSLWPCGSYLLATSAERVFCICANGSLLWKSAQVGLDGVVIHDVADHVVKGDGEWDPPGGWKPFRLSVNDGTLIKN